VEVLSLTLTPKAEGLRRLFLQLSALMTDFDFMEYFNKHCVLKGGCKIVPVRVLKGIWGSGDVTPIILNLTTMRLRWSWGSVLPLSTQVHGFKPGRSHQDFSGRKNPQHAFLWKGSKAVGSML